MDVTAKIVSYRCDENTPFGELHWFDYGLGDPHTAPHLNSITLRTAQVLSREVILATAFGQMIAAIINAEEGRLGDLVGRTFNHT